MNKQNQYTIFASNPNPYQYTRAVRFKIERQRQSQCFKGKWQQDEGHSVNLKHNLKQLVKSLLDVLNDLEDLFYYKQRQASDVDKPESPNKPSNRNGDQEYQNKTSTNKKLNQKLKVSKNWLKVWHKDVFYLSIKDHKANQGKYNLQKIESYLNLKKWLDDWHKNAKELKNIFDKPEESQARHSDIASLVRWFLNRRQLPYILHFLDETHVPYTDLDKKIKSLRENLKEIQTELKEAGKHYFPSQSSGVEIARASFNYYTVNKKPSDYEKELRESKDQKEVEPYSVIKNKNGFLWKLVENERQNQGDLFSFRSDQEKEWLRRYIKKNKIEGDINQGISLSLEQTYDAMKDFKAEQKSIFYELMTHIASDKKSGTSYTVKNEKHLLKGSEIPYDKHNCEGINETFSLFQFEIEKKQEFFRVMKVNQNTCDTKEKMYESIVKLSQEIARQNEDSKEKAKQQRGKLLFGNKCYFKKYGEFCEEYKKTAQRGGRLKAKIKGIEKQKEEASQTDYWGLVYVNDDKSKELWLIPKEGKEKLQEAKNFIDQRSSKQELKENYLCCFKSLTMRALNKLCFSEESDFVKGMPPDLKELHRKAKNVKTENDEQKISEKNQKKLTFLKEVLKSEYAKDCLDLEDFQEKNKNLWAKIFETETLDDFEKTLEKTCYHVKKIRLGRREKEKFLNKYDVIVLKITSYDLEDRNRNIHQTPESENKYHTDLWHSFWQNLDQVDKNQNQEVKGFPLGELRLNPEVRIRYHKVDENLKEYFKKKNFPEKFKHRRFQDQLTVSLTLALNAGKKYEELAFSKPEDLLKKIKNFNKEFNADKNFKTAWKYGIDRGNNELATLCLVRFNQDQGADAIGNNKKPDFASIECYKLKNYNHSETYTDSKGEKSSRKAVKNPSYFIHDKSLFEISRTSCLDLTTAKVIKGYIVTNGDVMTYLKLKKVSAKRRLYELYGKGKINEWAKLEWSEYEYKDGEVLKKNHHPDEVFLNLKKIKTDENTDGKPFEKTIYEYCKEYESVLSKEKIKKDLSRYLTELKSENESHTPDVSKINHIRDAITANMVGVIVHLQKQKNYSGFIVLEDLGEEQMNRHFFNSNENISSRLEQALYNKFQALGWVPPHIKDIFQLRKSFGEQQKKNNKKSNQFIKSQFGNIVFVDEEKTSKNCPHCGKTLGLNSKKLNDDLKFRQRRFVCQSCGFDTYYFYPLEKQVEDPDPQVNNNSNCKEKFQFLKDIDDPDKVAAYNIAKRH